MTKKEIYKTLRNHGYLRVGESGDAKFYSGPDKPNVVIVTEVPHVGAIIRAHARLCANKNNEYVVSTCREQEFIELSLREAINDIIVISSQSRFDRRRGTALTR